MIVVGNGVRCTQVFTVNQYIKECEFLFNSKLKLVLFGKSKFAFCVSLSKGLCGGEGAAHFPIIPKHFALRKYYSVYSSFECQWFPAEAYPPKYKDFTIWLKNTKQTNHLAYSTSFYDNKLWPFIRGKIRRVLNKMRTVPFIRACLI